MKIRIAVLFPLLAMNASVSFAHPEHDFDGKLRRGSPAAPAPTEKAAGRPGDIQQVTRTVNLVLDDKMSFSPAEVAVRQGETIRFVVTSSAKVPQQMVIATAAELRERAAMLKKFPKMSVNQANQVLVMPGRPAELVWQFIRVGEFAFACGAPACIDTGMIGRIVVTGL